MEEVKESKECRTFSPPAAFISFARVGEVGAVGGSFSIMGGLILDGALI